MQARDALTLLIFVLTMVLVLWKPRGYPEACWTVLGSGLMVGLGVVAPRDALGVVLSAKSALLFLLALLILSALLEKSGFFEWAAVLSARRARGNAKTLFRNVYLLGAITTAALSLDTTAVILTPIVLVLVGRLRLAPAPFLVGCAFVANMGSLLLPVSNLTNLIFANAFHLSFVRFVRHMFLPQVAALLVAFCALRIRFRAELARDFDIRGLPAISDVVAHRGYFRAALGVLVAVLLGYFLAPFAAVEPYVVGFAGALILTAFGVLFGRIGPASLRDVPWSIFPFVVGLFVVVRGIENAGATALASSWVSRLPHGTTTRILTTAGVTAAASNLLNNLPAALIAKSALLSSGSDAAAQFGALLGADLGPSVFPFASLATLLVLTSARKKGTVISVAQLIELGLWVTPLVVLAASLALALTFWL